MAMEMEYYCWTPNWLEVSILTMKIRHYKPTTYGSSISKMRFSMRSTNHLGVPPWPWRPIINQILTYINHILTIHQPSFITIYWWLCHHILSIGSSKNIHSMPPLIYHLNSTGFASIDIWLGYAHELYHSLWIQTLFEKVLDPLNHTPNTS